MALARYNGVAQDDKGNALAFASVEVRKESDGSLASLFSDRAGLTAIGNPFSGAGDGSFFFHAIGGSYKITVTKGSFSKQLRYVSLGLGAEYDLPDLGVLFNWDTGTADADPGAGNIRANNASLASATQLYVSKTNRLGQSISTFLASLDDSTNTSGDGLLILYDVFAQSQAMFITGAVTDASGYVKLAVSGHSGATSFPILDMMSFQFTRVGDRGSGTRYTFDSSTSMADPGTGELRLNNATLSSVTAMAISASSPESGNPSLSNWIKTWDDSTTTAHRGLLIISEIASPQNFAVYDVTAALTDNTTWLQATLTHVSSNGSFASGDELFVEFVRTGDTGASGIDAGIRWLFDSSTSMADPGAGDLRLNNATLASVTAIAISESSGEVGNPAVEAFLASLDDSTTTSHRGLLIIKKISAQQNLAIYAITGASTDNTSWWQLAVTHVSSAGSFSNTDLLSVQFYRTGNAGAGDMTKAVYDPNDDGIIAVGQGGSGASTAAGARTNFGVEYGKQSIWVPAGAMVPQATNGPPLNTIEMTTNDNMVRTLDFDTATQEYAQFTIRMPKSWNESTLTFIPLWSHPSTATNFGVAWACSAVAVSDDDALDVAFGSSVGSVDTGGTTNDLYHGPESGAMTVGGTPAAGDYVNFRIHRSVGDGGDTLAVDARLHGVLILYTNDNTNDT